MNTANTDTSRISISAHYTGYVWYKNGLSHKAFVTREGAFVNAALTPINAFIKAMSGANIDTFLMQRHAILDNVLTDLIENQGVTQVVELACGLSPRGYRLTQRYPKLYYIETDLPDMARRKRDLLSAMSDNANDRHQVRMCNILHPQGSESLNAVLAALDTSQPVVVISEGLVNYFALDTIKSVWSGIASALKAFPAGYYLTDLYPNLTDHPSYRYVRFSQYLVKRFTKGDWPLHYNSNQEIEAGFLDDGFAHVNVIDPADCYHQANVERTKAATMVRLICAKASV